MSSPQPMPSARRRPIPGMVSETVAPPPPNSTEAEQLAAGVVGEAAPQLHHGKAFGQRVEPADPVAMRAGSPTTRSTRLATRSVRQWRLPPRGTARMCGGDRGGRLAGGG
jgi:hypothetical protein